ncbi:MAG: penicillin-binding protein activator [Gammaproteobacteria bacterium]|nr:MAG: penicillin-binding protein activator [Gammaproteobacteria bacterium]
MPQALAAWRRRFPGHPASAALLASLEARARRARPRRLALLLPLSGAYAALGRAVRDGFLAAYWAGPERPEVLVLDTGGQAEGALEAYREAAAQGAGWVVGPLAKEAVRALRAQGRLPVPVLALNRSGEPGPPPAGFYAFGLAPEDEAAAAAERAWLEGHNQALLLAPRGDWGSRVLTAFARHWSGLGGEVLAAEVYDPSRTDFAAPLQRLLAIDASRARARALERLLGRPLRFEPRRRQDADLVFLAAFPAQGRQIRPQLRFYYAGDLPVYATSAIYAGHPDPVRDRDLDGVRFPDIPWVLRDRDPLLEALRRLWPERTARLIRLYALGVDAYRLVPELPRLAAFPFETVPGATGRLSLDPRHRVHRQLLWARFAGGRPRLLPPAAGDGGPMAAPQGAAPEGEPGAGPAGRASGGPSGVHPS